MIKVSRTGAGTATHAGSIRDTQGSGVLPIQATSNGTTSFRVVGRVSPEAPWVELKAAGTADFLESIAWVPFIQIEVISGTGTVTLWVGDN